MSTRIKNQAVKLYSDSETLFNDKTSRCEWHLDYSPIVTCDDTSEIILNHNVAIENVGVDSGFDFVIGSDKMSNIGITNIVTDLFETFITSGVKTGMYFMPFDNSVTGFALDAIEILSVDSETQLTLVSTYNATATDYYELSAWQYEGDVRTINNYAEFSNLGSSPSSESFLETPIKDGITYKISFTVTYIDPISPANLLQVKLGSNTILSVFTDDITATEYVAYGVSDGTTFQLLVSGFPVMNIDDIIISEMYNTTFNIKDCDDDVVKYNSVVSDFLYSSTKSQMRMDIDWINAVNGYACLGCFYVDVDQITDPNEELERISNGTFTGSTDWTFGTNWILSSGAALFTGASGDGNLSQTSLAYDLSKGVNYTVTFEIPTGFSITGAFDALLMDGGVEVLNLGNFSGIGLKSVDTGVMTSKCDEIRFVPTAESNNFSIDNVSILKNTTEEQFHYRTDCYSLADSFDCTVKLSGTNLDNAFNIDFNGLLYSPMIRVAGELMHPKFEVDKEDEEDSAGISSTLYFKSEASRNLFLYQLPPYLHDFIRLLIGYDTFKVDDETYVTKSGDYEPEYERQLGKVPDLGNAEIEVRPKEDFNVNKFC